MCTAVVRQSFDQDLWKCCFHILSNVCFFRNQNIRRQHFPRSCNKKEEMANPEWPNARLSWLHCYRYLIKCERKDAALMMCLYLLVYRTWFQVPRSFVRFTIPQCDRFTKQISCNHTSLRRFRACRVNCRYFGFLLLIYVPICSVV